MSSLDLGKVKEITLTRTTAQGAPTSAAASLIVDPTGADNTVLFAADVAGTGGNAISVAYAAPAVQATTTVAVVGNAITVTPGTKARMTISGPVTFTNTELKHGGTINSKPYWKSTGWSEGGPNATGAAAIYYNGTKWIVFSEGQYSAELTSSASFPDGLTGFTVTFGSGAPVMVAATTSAAQVITEINGFSAPSASLVNAYAVGTVTGAVAAVTAANLTGGTTGVTPSAIGQLCRVGDAAPFTWYRADTMTSWVREAEATATAFTPVGSIAATNVQAALVELDADLGKSSIKTQYSFEGDSMSADFSGIISWPEKLLAGVSYLGRSLYSNYATSGNTISQMVSQYVTQAGTKAPIITGAPGWFFLMGGTNDCVAETAAATIYNNIKILWAAAREDGYRVCAFTIASRVLSPASEIIRNSLNNLILSDSTLYDKLIRLDLVISNYLDTELVIDQTHLTDFGNKVLANHVGKSLNNDEESVVFVNCKIVSDQSVPTGVDTVVNFSQATENIGSGWNSAANKFTAPFSGIYSFCGIVYTLDTFTGLYIKKYIGGVIAPPNVFYSNLVSSAVSVGFHGKIRLIAGQDFTIRLAHSTGAGKSISGYDIGSPLSWLQISLDQRF